MSAPHCSRKVVIGGLGYVVLVRVIHIGRIQSSCEHHSQKRDMRKNSVLVIDGSEAETRDPWPMFPGNDMVSKYIPAPRIVQ